MKLKLDLPIDRWNFVLQKLEPHKKDSETITLFCNAIESLSFEESWPQKIFQCLTSNGKNPLKFPSTTDLKGCLMGDSIIKQTEMKKIKWGNLEKDYYRFLLDNYSLEKK